MHERQEERKEGKERVGKREDRELYANSSSEKGVYLHCVKDSKK